LFSCIIELPAITTVPSAPIRESEIPEEEEGILFGLPAVYVALIGMGIISLLLMGIAVIAICTKRER